GVERAIAEQVVSYLGAAAAELGALPTANRLVLERFFDDTGGMQLVVHSPHGARVNRGLGLALRKRFCRTFDFELQAAASDDAVVLSLGPQHSYPLEEVMGFMSPGTVRDTLVQAVLPTPMFNSRWRWNLTRSLVAPRFRGSRRVPPAIQRMEADDLMAAVFPALAACQENVSGPIEIPDHPIVRQTLHDCCTEAMDLAGLTSLLERVRSGEVQAHCVDTVTPSVLAEEILNGRPYTFLDDAPLEERRTRAVATRRGIPIEARDLAALDPHTVARVVEQASPEPRHADELHDMLCSLVLAAPRPEWQQLFDSLAAGGRAMLVELPGGVDCGGPPVARWVATEARHLADALLPGACYEPDHRLPAAIGLPVVDRGEALAVAVQGHLEILGPVRIDELGRSIGTGSKGELRSALAQLEGRGSVLGCRIAGDGPGAGTEDTAGQRFCARHLLARIHAAMRDRSRRSVQPVSVQHLMRFLVSWQHVGSGSRLLGAGGVAEIVEQLQGYEAAVGAWESAILPARVAAYHGALLDEWCARGELGFGRLGLRVVDPPGSPPRRGGATPSPATPVSWFRRDDLDWLLVASRRGLGPELPAVGAALEVIEVLGCHGALFVNDLCQLTGRLPGEVAEALWDGMARGLLTADGFQAVRSLLSGRGHLVRPAGAGPVRGSLGGDRTGSRTAPSRPGLPRPGRARSRVRPAVSGGRWSILGEGLPGAIGDRHGASATGADRAGMDRAGIRHAGSDRAGPDLGGLDPDELSEAIAGQLLLRWGVVFRDLVSRESLAVGWRDILWAFRRLEARGLVLGGRFVAGFSGEQFALPEAAEQLQAIVKAPLEGVAVQLSAADPLNLTGVILPGPRVPSSHTKLVTLRDGMVEIDDASVSGRRAAGGAGPVPALGARRRR
ncbi:MAG TPA: hypothetical protein VNE21_08485, partial [Mycobacteriales bacterium]|nr:hypothetical protein [Mycobacteriales bacterium]